MSDLATAELHPRGTVSTFWRINFILFIGFGACSAHHIQGGIRTCNPQLTTPIDHDLFC